MSTTMDMHIAGSGNIPAGEYNKVSISGSGHLYGKVRCASFSASGSAKGESIECAESFKVSGSAHFSEEIKAASIGISGALHCDGNLTATEKISCSGSAKCEKSIKCEALSMAGMLSVGGDIEAENVKIDGVVHCEGLLNAENIEIKFKRGMSIGSIGGSKIVILSERTWKSVKRLPLFSSLSRAVSKDVAVNASIEGDEIAVEYVSCPRITGRVVAIGQGCNVGLVQYSEAIEISPDAKVERTEKI